jgi:hypothetical protein
MRLDFLMVINIHNMVSEDVMPGRSVGRYQLFGRKCYIYLQDTSIFPNTLIRRRSLGPRTKFHTNRKQLTYHSLNTFQYFMYSDRRDKTDKVNSI